MSQENPTDEEMRELDRLNFFPTPPLPSSAVPTRAAFSASKRTEDWNRRERWWSKFCQDHKDRVDEVGKPEPWPRSDAEFQEWIAQQPKEGGT